MYEALKQRMCWMRPHLKCLSISSRVLCLVSGTKMMENTRPVAATAVYTQKTPEWPSTGTRCGKLQLLRKMAA